MPLLLIPVVFAAIAFGVYRLYATVARQSGVLAGLAVVLLLIAAVLAVIAYFVHKYRFIHGKAIGGQRVLTLPGDWGQLTLDASRKQGMLNMGNQDTHFIFADIAGVARINQAGRQALAVRLQHASQPEWHIPMANDRQARRWERILKLAAQQKL